MNKQINEVLEERDPLYGQAWIKTGLVVKLLGEDFINFVRMAPELSYNWITILCKLVRLLTAPYHRDSWLDIGGYAKLVVDYLDRVSKESVNDDQLSSERNVQHRTRRGTLGRP